MSKREIADEILCIEKYSLFKLFMSKVNKVDHQGWE
jgi:hypothetical protein